MSVILSVRLPRSLSAALRDEAIAAGTSVSHMVRRALVAALGSPSAGGGHQASREMLDDAEALGKSIPREPRHSDPAIAEE